jgi:hypothetical protein
MLKNRPSLTEMELIRLQELSRISADAWTEEDVREEFITPLLRLLGYRKDTDYSISRAQSHSITYLMVGRERVQVDYICHVRREKLWIIEAKPGITDITDRDILQANYYSLHPEIDAPYFLVTNAREIQLFERDNRNPDGTPNLRLLVTDLVDPTNFYRLDSIIGSTQLLPTLKGKLLQSISKVLAAEVYLDRLEEFSSSVTNVINHVRPKVLENFRHNAKLREEDRSFTFQAEISNYVGNINPYQAVDTLFLNGYPLGQAEYIYEAIQSKLSKYPNGTSQSYLFAFKLLTLEDFFVRTNYFYVNQIGFLMHLHRTKIKELDRYQVEETLFQRIQLCLDILRATRNIDICGHMKACYEDSRSSFLFWIQRQRLHFEL